MEENGNCAVTSESVEDLSEYTDADESMSAPTEILAEFLSAVMLKDYENALKYCKMILQYEPNHATAKEFYPLILEKIVQGASDLIGDRYKKTKSSPSSSSLSSRVDSDEVEIESADESESDAEVEDVSAGSGSRATSSNSSSSASAADERLSTPESDGTTASYSSIEDEVADNNLASGLKPNSVPNKSDDNSFEANGNKEASDSESPTEPVSQRLTDRLMAAVFPNVL